MLIAVACDHGGFRMKGELARLLTSTDHTCYDLGPHDGGSADYPDYAELVATA
jgi:ribose 5-phosphate isomerase B